MDQSRDVCTPPRSFQRSNNGRNFSKGFRDYFPRRTRDDCASSTNYIVSECVTRSSITFPLFVLHSSLVFFSVFFFICSASFQFLFFILSLWHGGQEWLFFTKNKPENNYPPARSVRSRRYFFHPAAAALLHFDRDSMNKIAGHGFQEVAARSAATDRSFYTIHPLFRNAFPLFPGAAK